MCPTGLQTITIVSQVLRPNVSAEAARVKIIAIPWIHWRGLRNHRSIRSAFPIGRTPIFPVCQFLSRRLTPFPWRSVQLPAACDLIVKIMVLQDNMLILQRRGQLYPAQVMNFLMATAFNRPPCRTMCTHTCATDRILATQQNANQTLQTTQRSIALGLHTTCKRVVHKLKHSMMHIDAPAQLLYACSSNARPCAWQT